MYRSSSGAVSATLKQRVIQKNEVFEEHQCKPGLASESSSEHGYLTNESG